MQWSEVSLEKFNLIQIAKITYPCIYLEEEFLTGNMNSSTTEKGTLSVTNQEPERESQS